MKCAFSDEQEELRRSVARFLADKSAEAAVRDLMETVDGYDELVWSQMAQQLGLQSLIIPEEYGGSGYSYLELAIVFQAMGAAMTCAPFFATVALAANALLTSGDRAAQARWLPRIAAGETVATLALTEDSGNWDPASILMSAEAVDSGWVLSGRKNFVIDGHLADLILVGARTETGLSLFAVRGDAAGLTRTPLATLDATRKHARLEFDRTRAALIGVAGQAHGALLKTLDLAAVALAAEQVGGAQRCLQMSVEYAKLRTQFDQPIGSFQAIKHKCAEMLLDVESARSASFHAARAAATGAADLPVVASLVKAHCSRVFAHVASETIQIHGGIGFTWEHSAQLFFKRAKSSELLFGDPAYHREQLAMRAGI